MADENGFVFPVAKEYWAVFRLTDMHNEVKPCPFCGERKEIWALRYVRTDIADGARYGVGCMGCMAILDSGYWQGWGQALAAWNTRKEAHDE